MHIIHFCVVCYSSTSWSFNFINLLDWGWKVNVRERERWFERGKVMLILNSCLNIICVTSNILNLVIAVTLQSCLLLLLLLLSMIKNKQQQQQQQQYSCLATLLRPVDRNSIIDQIENLCLWANDWMNERLKQQLFFDRPTCEGMLV